MKHFLFLWILLLFCLSSEAQNRYWVFFTDKNGSVMEDDYFDPLAVERRIRNQLPPYDFSDLPVCPAYVEGISKLADTVSSVLRWFNAAGITASAENAERIASLPYVRSVEPMPQFPLPLCGEATAGPDSLLGYYNAMLMRIQLELMDGKAFIDAGYDGSGVRIAIFDGGFPGVDKHPAFEHIRKRNGIIATRDFVKNRDFVYKYNPHGTMVMSCIGGMADGERMGLATGAEFLLARTEMFLEPYSEEENWLQAVEWADKNGAHIINSSLGYTHHRYFKSQMDGKTSLVARAANMAASKGILVVNAAGNEGFGKWVMIGTPADADSVLSVGGVGPYSGWHISFSSFGPTADGRMKPNVAASGEAAVASAKGWTRASGTSFASPLTAGFAACALQSRPNMKCMDLFHEIEKSASLYPYFDYAHGFGIPQAGNLLAGRNEISESFSFVSENDSIIIRLHQSPEPDTGNNYKYSEHLLYYKIADDQGRIASYKVLRAVQPDVVKIAVADIPRGFSIVAHYRKYTSQWKP